jgi:hypothetical protein
MTVGKDLLAQTVDDDTEQLLPFRHALRRELETGKTRGKPAVSQRTTSGDCGFRSLLRRWPNGANHPCLPLTCDKACHPPDAGTDVLCAFHASSTLRPDRSPRFTGFTVHGRDPYGRYGRVSRRQLLVKIGDFAQGYADRSVLRSELELRFKKQSFLSDSASQSAQLGVHHIRQSPPCLDRLAISGP